MINIEAPNTYEIERRYIFTVIFTEFLGLDIHIDFTDRQNVLIKLDDDKNIIVADGLFSTSVENWLKASSLPDGSLKSWNMKSVKLNALTVSSSIPIIYGENPDNPNFFTQSDEHIYLGLDIFGSAFFMLSRYEELVKPDRDKLDRFPADASLAYQEGFLDRPIINEYLEILWACIVFFNPKQERKLHHFQLNLTHDVDEPYRFAFSGIGRLARRCAGDIYNRRSFRQALNSIHSWVKVKTGNIDSDPCNTFNMIMDISEKHEVKSAFYFITDRTSSYDCDYSIKHPLLRKLMQQIHERGHEIGLHPSYNTYKDIHQTKKEFDVLKEVCDQEGIQQLKWGGRQHYLRWNNPTTWQNWEEAGLDYDSTLSFAETLGFRCGTCYEYSTFDLINKKHLKLKEIPLTIMDATVFRENYMNLGGDNSGLGLQLMIRYKDLHKKFNGCFTLLWHNSYFNDLNYLQPYLDLISS